MTKLAKTHRATAEATGRALALAGLGEMRGDERRRKDQAQNIILHLAREVFPINSSASGLTIKNKRLAFRAAAEAEYVRTRTAILDVPECRYCSSLGVRVDGYCSDRCRSKHNILLSATVGA